MSIESYQRTVLSHQREIGKLQQEKGKEVSRAADYQKRANDANQAATRASNISSAQSKIRDAERYQSDAARCFQKVGDIEMKIAREQERLHDAQRRLVDEEKKVTTQRQREYERQISSNDSRLQAISSTLVKHQGLHTVALSAIERLSKLPERIVVLFFASNPVEIAAGPSGHQQLRLDEEVRAISEMIRKSEHRDAVKLESRWAVRPMDVLQAINELHPRIIHFSGHGSDRDEIVFQDENGNPKFVSKDAIVQTMAAASSDIQLVFFNTCYSRNQAESLVEHIPAAIGMNTSSPLEVEASTFAGSLLMPDHLFIERVSGRRPTPAVTNDLCEYFGTTLTATLLRYVETSSDYYIFVLSEKNRIRWWRASDSFGEHELWIENKTPLSEDSVAASFFRGETMSTKPQHLDIKTWLSELPGISSETIIEQAFPLHSYGQVISILYLP